MNKQKPVNKMSRDELLDEMFAAETNRAYATHMRFQYMDFPTHKLQRIIRNMRKKSNA